MLSFQESQGTCLFQLFSYLLGPSSSYLLGPFYLTVTGVYVYGRFYTKDALSVRTNLGKHLWFVWLCVPSIKTGTRRIMRLDESSFEIRLERRTTKGSSSGRVMRLMPVFILETHNQTNYKMFAQVRP